MATIGLSDIFKACDEKLAADTCGVATDNINCKLRTRRKRTFQKRKQLCPWCVICSNNVHEVDNILW